VTGPDASGGRDPLASPGGGRRPPWSEFRAALETAHFRPTKGLGQNFLVDPNAAKAIAAEAELGPGARVLEIGAGCGFLTVHLAELGVELVAVEIDERLLAIARRFLAGESRVRFVLADVLAGKHALAPAVAEHLPAREAWHLVSNLPYSISAPVLAVLARLANPPRSMTVLVQEEVAERVAAEPGGEAWGALTARLALLYRARLLRRVGAQLFWPRPRVGSRVVRLDLQPLEGLRAQDLSGYDALVDGLFQHRRKQLLPVLAGHLGGDRERAAGVLEGLGLDPRLRPEALAPAALLALARASPRENGGGPERA